MSEINGNVKWKPLVTIIIAILGAVGTVLMISLNQASGLQEVGAIRGERISTLEANVLNLTNDVKETNEVVKDIYQLLIK